MAHLLALIVFRGLCFLFQWGTLALAAHQKSPVWRGTLYVGMLMNGISAFGYLRPDLLPGADLIGLIGTSLTYGGVFVSYLLAANGPAAAPKRTILLREMGLAFALLFALAIIATSAVNKRSEIRAQESLTDVVYSLTREVSGLHRVVSGMDTRLRRMEADTLPAATNPTKPHRSR